MGGCQVFLKQNIHMCIHLFMWKLIFKSNKNVRVVLPSWFPRWPSKAASEYNGDDFWWRDGQSNTTSETRITVNSDWTSWQYQHVAMPFLVTRLSVVKENNFKRAGFYCEHSWLNMFYVNTIYHNTKKCLAIHFALLYLGQQHCCGFYTKHIYGNISEIWTIIQSSYLEVNKILEYDI